MKTYKFKQAVRKLVQDGDYKLSSSALDSISLALERDGDFDKAFSTVISNTKYIKNRAIFLKDLKKSCQ